MEECATCNPFVAMVCDEDGAFGRPCYEMTPAGASGLLPDSTGTLTPFPQGTDHLVGPDEEAPSVSLQPNPGALPYSEPVCGNCEDKDVTRFGCPIRAAKRGNLDRAYRAGRCPDATPACGLSRDETNSAYQRAECKACIGEAR